MKHWDFQNFSFDMKYLVKPTWICKIFWDHQIGIFPWIRVAKKFHPALPFMKDTDCSNIGGILGNWWLKQDTAIPPSLMESLSSLLSIWINSIAASPEITLTVHMCHCCFQSRVSLDLHDTECKVCSAILLLIMHWNGNLTPCLRGWRCDISSSNRILFQVNWA